MHVALISDTPWLDEELPQFRVLVVGLMDDQVRVAQVVPQELDLHEASAFGARVAWADTDWRWLREYRLSRLALPLRKLGVDLIHALDARLWAGGLRLARALGAPLVCAASGAQDLDAAGRLLHRADDIPLAFTAATAPIADALRDRVGQDVKVYHVTPGLHTPAPGSAAMPAEPQEPHSPTALCAVVTGSGQMDDDYQSLLEAMSRLIATQGDAQFFFDARQTDQHSLWLAARRMNLLANISFVPRRLGHHELLLRADVLIQPQALGQARGLTLQAMAHGIPVIARTDPWLDYLHHERSAWVVDSAQPVAWLNRLRMIIDEPAAADALGRSARQYIAENHRVVRQIDQILGLYRQSTGEAYKFENTT